jgi:hypothetical protein
MMFVAGPVDGDGSTPFADRRQIWFDGPDGAYLAMASVRRYLDASVVSDVILVPSDRGPALELPASAVSHKLVQALIRRFGGHIGRAGPPPGSMPDLSSANAQSYESLPAVPDR